jgi:hypothetical protein
MADLTGMMQAAAGAAGAAGGENLYIEDVFSTYLYTGNGSTQTITNDIDLDGEGGLVWIKNREEADSHILTDTERGATEILSSNSDAAEATDADTLTAFNSDGFALGADVKVNTSTEIYASWTFRKAPKFFDVVTYTGTGSARTVAHNLGSVPGCIIVKRTDSTGDWIVYHRANTANPETDYLELNDTAATADLNTMWNDTAPTSTEFTVGTDNDVNASTATYVAYLWAHDAGGFGDDGEQNVVTCGAFTASGANASVTLGWEPQWILFKKNSTTGSWILLDTMRGWANGTSGDPFFSANASSAENAAFDLGNPTATGFELTNLDANQDFVYIAIRRGPMKTPTAGTEVFNPVVYTGTNADNRLVNTSLLTDMVMIKERNDTVDGMVTGDRLRGNPYMLTGADDAEVTDADTYMTPTSGYGNAFAAMNGVGVGNEATLKVNIDTTANNHVAWAFRRAPGFFDVVAYTGTQSARTITHNLGVVPELIIVKNRDDAYGWQIYAGDETDYLVLTTTAATADNVNRWNDTAPTASVFTIGTAVEVNTSTDKYIAYLFATLPGVSDIGTYTGNGSSVTVTTGFQPRFILVKRTDSTGNWIVGDSARGLVAGDDPFLLLNSTAAETTNQDWVDVSATGFTVNETAANANVNTATYIYLAIA